MNRKRSIFVSTLVVLVLVVAGLGLFVGTAAGQNVNINSPTQANPLNTTTDNVTSSQDPTTAQPVTVNATVTAGATAVEFVRLNVTDGGTTRTVDNVSVSIASGNTQNVFLGWNVTNSNGNNHPGENDAGNYSVNVTSLESGGTEQAADNETGALNVFEPVKLLPKANLEVSTYEDGITFSFIPRIDRSGSNPSQISSPQLDNTTNPAGSFNITTTPDDMGATFLALDPGDRYSIRVDPASGSGYASATGSDAGNVSGQGSVSQIEEYTPVASVLVDTDPDYTAKVGFDVLPPTDKTVDYDFYDNRTGSFQFFNSDADSYSLSSLNTPFESPFNASADININFDALNFTESYKTNATTTGYNLTQAKFRDGSPGNNAAGDDPEIFYSFEGQNVTINYTATLNKTAPAGGTNVTVNVTSGDTGFSNVSENISVSEGTDGSTVIADNTTEVGAINSTENYTITIDPEGYESNTTVEYSSPGSTLDVSFGTLDAKPMNISANATLGVSAPTGGKNVTYKLYDNTTGDLIKTKYDDVNSGDFNSSVNFTDNQPLGFGDDYNVTINVSGYETDGLNETTPGAPGANESVSFGTLAAEPVNISASADLEVTAPDLSPDDVNVTFVLNNTTTATPDKRLNDTLTPGDSVASVNFTNLDALNQSDDYNITAESTEYNTTITPSNPRFGVLSGEPGANQSVNIGELGAEDTNVNVTATLNTTAPSGGTTVSILVDSPNGSTASDTVTVGQGGDTAKSNFTVSSLNFTENYTVTVDAPGYQTPVQNTTPGATNQTEFVNFTLDAEPVDIAANATLNTTAPPGGFNATFFLNESGTEVANNTTFVGEGANVTPTVRFDNQTALNASDSYNISIKTDEDYYNTTGVNESTPGQPGGAESVTLGPLNARNVTVDYRGNLSVTAPPGGVQVNVSIGVPGGSDVTDSLNVSEGTDGSTVIADNTTEAPAINFSDTYNVTLSANGYENASNNTVYGFPNSTADVDVGTLQAKNTTVDYNGTLEVTAPAGGVNVTVDVAVPGGNNTTDEVFVPQGQNGSTVIADNVTEADAIDFSDNYTVTLNAPGYESATAEGYGPPNGTANIDVGVLAAKNVSINATADLEVTAPEGGVAANFTLYEPGNLNDPIEFNNTTIPEGGAGATVDLGNHSALNFSEDYTVNVTTQALNYSAMAYLNNSTTTPGAPGANETADLGTLEAQDVNVTSTAELEVTASAGGPPNGIDANHSLVHPNGTVVDSQVDTISPGDNQTTVNLTGNEALNFSQNYTVNINTTANGYDSGAYFNESLETPGAPGANETTDFGTLDAMNVTVDAEATLGVTAPAGGVNATFTAASNETAAKNFTLTDYVAPGDDRANVTFNVSALNYSEQYNITVDTETDYNKSGYNTTGLETTAGKPGAGPAPADGDESVDFGTLEALDVQIDTNVTLGVTAPEGGVDVVFELYSESGLSIERRIDQVDAGNSTASVDFGNQSALDFADNYTVRMQADGYASDGVSEQTPGAPEANETVRFEELGAEDVEVRAESSLNTTAPEGGVTLEYGLEQNGSQVDTVTDFVGEGDDSSGPVNFGLQSPLNYSEEYNVTVTADGYNTTGVVQNTSGAPGEVQEVSLGSLDAENVTVGAEATLGVTAPTSGTQVNFTLVEAGVTQNTTVDAGNDTASVTFGEQPPLDASSDYTVEVNATGYDTEGVTETTPGAPNATENVDFGTLTAEDTVVNATATLGVPAPSGGVDVEFELAEEGITQTATVAEDDDTANVSFGEQAALNENENYTVRVDATGYVTDGVTETVPGAPGVTDTANFGTLDANNVTVNAEAELGVTAPAGGVNVTFGVDETGDTSTVQLAEGDSSASATFDLMSNGNYTVTVDSAEYMTDGVNTTVPGVPGSTETADLGTLTPENVTVNAEATLGVTAPAGGKQVNFTLVETGATQTATVNAGDENASVSFGGQEALDASDSYTVAVDADGYSTVDVTGTTPGAPNATENVDLGTFDAEKTEIGATADLGTPAPSGGVAVEFELTNATGTVATATDSLVEDEENATVDFGAQAALDNGTDYTVEVDATGYATDGVNATTPGEPGDARTVDLGTLAADTANVNATADLGVTAPASGVTVEFALTGGSVDTTDTVTVGEGNSTATVDFGSVRADEDYTVTVDAPGYETSGLSESLADVAGNVTADFGTLAAEDASVAAEVSLDPAAIEGGVAVTFELSQSGSTVATATDSLVKGEDTATADFGARSALNSSDSYNVTVTAAGYNTSTDTTPGAPGTSDTVDLGTIAGDLPDIQVTDVEATNDPVVEGDNLTVDVTVENNGTIEGINENVTLEVDNDTDGIVDAEVGGEVNVSGNEQATVTLAYTTQAGDAPEVEVGASTDDHAGVGITDTAQVDAPADIQVTNVTSLNDPVKEGDDLDVQVGVQNTGDRIGATDIALNVYTQAGDTIEDVDVEEETFVAAGSTKNVTLTYTTQLGDNGTATVGGVTGDDPAGMNDSVEINATQKDLVVTRVSPEDPVVEGDALDVEVTVENRGDRDATNEPVVIEVDNDTDGTYETTADSATVDVPKGTDRTVTLTYTTNSGDADEVGLRGTIAGADRTDTASVSTPADLEVFSVEPHDPVVEGENLTVDVTVQNDGGTRGETDYILEVDGNETDRIQDVRVGANAQITKTLTYTTQDGDAPNVTVTGIANNTSVTKEAEVLEPAEFDVTNINPASETVLQGEDLTVTADVTNLGDVTGEANVTFTVSNSSGTQVDAGLGNVTLGGGETTQVSAQLTNISLAAGNYTHEIATQDGSQSGSLEVQDPSALFTQPLINHPEFNNPPQNVSGLGDDPTLYEDLNGNGDGTNVTQTIQVFRELVLGGDLGLTDQQAEALNWDEDSPSDEVTTSDMVSLFGEQIRAD